MTAYRVTATLTVEMASGDTAQLEATAKAGLAELPAIASRYGVTITASDVTVEPAGS
ncbi:MAG TPA: hypothetical protein VNR36_11440 [Pseudolysinimonas sp.]|nr:hypothetical protein [Pseudolysinimonas sp.]